MRSTSLKLTRNIEPARPPLRLARDREISVIVPALNEAKNLPMLMARIHKALKSRVYEVIVVDDNSRDDTPAVCEELAQQFPLRLMVRHRATNGLSGAVLHGMEAARGEKIVVMDADLQHPPEKIPELLAKLETGEADFALGSRYVDGGTTEETWSWFRRVNSNVATWLAKPFAGGTRDPMSGFFALRRESYENASQLTPLGYKIALELMCKCRARRIAEVPIHFGERIAGESKLSLKQQARYLRHLSRLYAFMFPRTMLFGKALAGAVAGWTFGYMTHPALCAVLSVLTVMTMVFSTRSRVVMGTRKSARDTERVFGFKELRAMQRAA
jgi:dolichol-phosphate mannosyltransferase